MVSVAVAASLSLINACEKNRQSEPVQKLSYAEQRGSAEGLVLAGLLALKRCREWGETRQEPCRPQIQARNTSQ